jgi:hypothetical protein
MNYSGADMRIAEHRDRQDATASLLRATRAVLAEREAELLELKGACSTAVCRLHRAHRGPCDIPDARVDTEEPTDG